MLLSSVIAVQHKSDLYWSDLDVLEHDGQGAFTWAAPKQDGQ